MSGIRHDAWAEKNRIPNAVEKTGSEKGEDLHPDFFGKPEQEGIYDRAPQAVTPEVTTKH